MTSGHPLADCDLGALRIRLGVEVLTNQSWDVSFIAGDLLLAHLVSGTGDPVGCILATVAKDVLERLVLRSHVREGILLVEGREGLVSGVVQPR
jgi:hypothetical protein